MDLAVVEVEVEAAVRREHAVGLDETRLEEREVVVEQVAEALRPDDEALVAASLEADAIAFVGADGLEPGPLLDLPGVEGRVDVDQVHRCLRHRPEDVEVVGEVDPACHVGLLTSASFGCRGALC